MHDFKKPRQFCAWLGLTPGQHSSGGKAKLGTITKAGDTYLQTVILRFENSRLVRRAVAVSVIGQGKTFRSRHGLAAYLRLVARQGGSRGKVKLTGISDAVTCICVRC